MKKNNIAAVIVSHNEKTKVTRLIRSLMSQLYKSFDIYLIDNSSIDGTQKYINKFFPFVKIFRNDKNIGFARAANQGMKTVFESGYKLAIVLNSDLLADQKMIAELVKTFRRSSNNKKIGMVQPLLLIQGTKLINSSGNPLHYLGFGYAGNYKKNMNTIPKNDYEVSSVPGGAMMITREFYKDLGGFDESFFMYCEDQDLSWRGLLKGYSYYLSRKALLYHQYHFNKGKKKLYYYERNRWRMLLKNYSLKTLVLLLPALVLNELLLVGYSIIGGWFLYKILAYLTNLASIFLIVSKRGNIQKSRLVSDSRIFDHMSNKIDFALINTDKISTLTMFVNKVYIKYYDLVKSSI